MPREVIQAPWALGERKRPFSPATRAGDFVFVSGHGGFEDPSTGEPLEGIEAQTRQCIENIKKVLDAAGASLDDVVKVNIYLANADDFPKMNEVYQESFPKDWPARTTVVTRFTIPSMIVVMDFTAYCPAAKG